jgi:zinc finger-like protein
MPGSISNIRFIHVPIRNDLRRIERELSALASHDSVDVGPIADRFAFLERVLSVHEQAEEEFLFPAIEAKAPGTASAYEQAHRSMDLLRERLRTALASSGSKLAHQLASVWPL